jgi:hypothetical protein
LESARTWAASWDVVKPLGEAESATDRLGDPAHPRLVDSAHLGFAD